MRVSNISKTARFAANLLPSVLMQDSTASYQFPCTMKMKPSKLFVPLGKFLGLMPDVFVLAESELAAEVKNSGFAIESQWHHGMKNIDIFMIARKI